MTQVFLILAHEKADQLSALIERLAPADGPNRAVVHIDRKSPLWRETRGRFLAGNSNVTLVARPVAVRWGHASQLAATRLLLRAALARPFDLAHLISGADWPVVPPAAMAASFAGACHIEVVPGVQSERMKRIRLDARMLRPDPGRPSEWYPARTLRHLSALLPARRLQPWGPWQKGSQWWSLPRDVCEVVLAGLDRAFATGLLAGTVCADEHLIQTIVAHQFPDRIATNRRFLRWGEGASPAILGAGDLPQILASGAWFARKVSAEADDFFHTLPSS